MKALRMNAKVWTLVLGMVVGIVAGLAVSSSPTDAQGPSATHIAAGPGGVWVLRGNRISVCIPGQVRQGVAPAAPICGPSSTIP